MVKNIHKWILGHYEPEWYKTESINIGISGGIMQIPVPPAQPATSTFVCECGAKKEVIHEEGK